MSTETGEKTATQPRRRGRPAGSKTKNRLNKDDSTILVQTTIRRPMHYNLVEAARELGISHAFLYQKAKEEGGIYLPAHKDGRYTIYTEMQIRIISHALRGRISAERGRELWERIDDQDLVDLSRLGGGSAT